MDLIIRTAGVTDLSAAAVTSASDLTALTAPDELPQLVLGTTEPMTVKFVSAAGTFEAWSDDPAYSVMATLGGGTADGTDSYAEAAMDTVISDGKSGDLNLDTTKLNDAIGLAFLRNRRAATVQLVLQITVTDPTGDRRTYAMIPVTVWGKVSTYTPDAANNPPALQAVIASRAGLIAAPSNFLAVNSVLIPSGKTLKVEGVTTLGRVRRDTTFAASYGFVHYGATNSSGGGSLSQNDIYAFGYNVGASGVFDTPTQHQLYQGFESDYVNGGVPTLEWYVRFNTPTDPGPSATHEPIFSGFNKNTNRIFETALRGDLIQLANSDGSYPFAKFSSADGVEIFAATTITGSFLSVTASVADDAAVQIAKTFGGADGEVQRLLNITGTDLAVASTSAHYLIGAQVTSGELNIAAGVTDTGYRIGLNILGHANSSTFLGTLATQIGVRTSVGILDSGSSGARAITSSAAFQAECQLADAGTITTGYLFRGTYSGSTATVTNKWGLYITGEAKNYLSGLLQLGTVTEYANNAAAITGGLVAGQVYRTGEALKIVY